MKMLTASLVESSRGCATTVLPHYLHSSALWLSSLPTSQLFGSQRFMIGNHGICPSVLRFLESKHHLSSEYSRMASLFKYSALRSTPLRFHQIYQVPYSSKIISLSKYPIQAVEILHSIPPGVPAFVQPNPLDPQQMEDTLKV